ncbi:MAG: diacylglycerol kinase family lipid kinase [Clostridia bacterium]|nr:diacylglycerol kinase family lipid kinase [Clostridia bacterium]
MKHIFVHNPMAGKNSAKAIETLQEHMKQYDGSLCYEFYSTKARGDATLYVKQLCEAEPETEFRFYACGGDGTANEVLHGVMGHSNASMTCYPCGSGNDFVKYYGGADRFLNIDALLNAEEHHIDVMRIGDRYSMNVVNFGFETEVVRYMEKARHKKFMGGKKAYYAGIVKALCTSMKSKCTIWVDDEQINDGSMLLCNVANGSYIGGSFCCAPHSNNEDGLLEVCLVHPISRLKFLSLVNVYKEGRHLDDPRFRNIVVYRRGKSVHVKAPEGFSCTLDGEIVPTNEFTIEICPGALRFAVPALPADEATQPDATDDSPVQNAEESEKSPATV